MAKAATTTHPGRPHRRDIQGLRAIAVIVVIAFHAGATWLPGGFIGVDMFFVVSGFLITRTIRDEYQRDGNFKFFQFFVRRLRRLFPSALVVIVATLAVVYFLGPAQKFKGYAGDAISSMLYFSNIRFAFNETGYFADAIASPFLHLWSLSVEEQFYLALALMLMLFRSFRTHRLARFMFGLTVVSLILSVVGSILWPEASYYNILMRGWEFGVGSIISIAASRLVKISARAATTLRVLGLVLVAGGLLFITEDMAYPGYLALAPTLGTAFLVAAGCSAHTDFIRTALSWRPVTFIGDISYSLYLWHWPALTVPAIILGSKLGVRDAVLAVLASFILAIFTYYLLEKPLRLSSRDIPRVIPNFAVAGSIAAVMIGGSVLAIEQVNQRFSVVQAGTQISTATVQDIGIGATKTTSKGSNLARTGNASEESTASPTIGSSSAATGQTANSDTKPTSTAAATPQPAPKPVPKMDTPVGNLVFPASKTLSPGIPDVAGYAMRADQDGCLVDLTSSGVKVCSYGSATAKQSIVLFGDSHAEALYPAFVKIAAAKNWTLHVITKSACAPSTITLGAMTGTSTMRASCYNWRQAAVAKIAQLKPALIVMSGYQGDVRRTLGVSSDQFNPLWTDGFSTMVKNLPTTSKVLFISDTPDWSNPPITCIANNPGNYGVCNNQLSKLSSSARIEQERATLEPLGVTVMNLNNVLCPNGICNVIDRNYVVYKDAHHLLGPYVAALAPYFWQATEAALN